MGLSRGNRNIPLVVGGNRRRRGCGTVISTALRICRVPFFRPQRPPPGMIRRRLARPPNRSLLRLRTRLRLRLSHGRHHGSAFFSRSASPSYPGLPFWPSWHGQGRRSAAAMQRFSHFCHVRYPFPCCSGRRMLPDCAVRATAEGFLATSLPRRSSATHVRQLVRAVGASLPAQVGRKPPQHLAEQLAVRWPSASNSQ